MQTASRGRFVTFAPQDGQYREGALAPIRERDSHDVTAPRAEQRVTDRRGERDLRALRVAAAAADELVLGFLARLIADAHDESEPGDAMAGDRGIDDGGRGDQSLELSDLDPLDRRVLEHRQVVVVVDGGPVGARVSEPLGEIGAVRAAKRLQFADGLVRSAGLSSTPPAGAANCERNCGSSLVSYVMPRDHRER